MANFKATFNSILQKASSMEWHRIGDPYWAEEYEQSAEEHYRCCVPIDGQNASITIRVIETTEADPRFALVFDSRLGAQYHFIHRGQWAELREQIELAVTGEHKLASTVDEYLENL